MATISLTITDAALALVTNYAQSQGTTAESLIANQGLSTAVRSAYAEAVRKLTQAGNLPACVRARVAADHNSVWQLLSNEMDRTGDVDADIAKAISGE